MPLGKGVRYRMKDGVRLAFKGNRVVETKDMGTGKVRMPISHLPPGVSLSPKGDLCAVRMKEMALVFPRPIKGMHPMPMPTKMMRSHAKETRHDD